MQHHIIKTLAAIALGAMLLVSCSKEEPNEVSVNPTPGQETVSFLSRGTGLTIIAIIIVLAVIGGIALLLRIVRRKHKKTLAFYLILFAVFTAMFFLSALLIDKHGSLYSVIDGAIHGVVVTVLWWIFDQGHEQIKASIKEDEADHKR